jgi:(1->4)-alpha-D-glucan 1-alpha-D-glucosylmutase
MEERYREQTIVRQRLAALLAESAAVRSAFGASIGEINGQKDDARSFDRLEKLLEGQWYRLAYWRVAVDEINYRRFFDVNDLAAIRVEDPRVFDAVHRLVGRLVGAGWVTGLRIDHPDGLRDPQNYFKKLHALYRSQRANGGDEAAEIYVVAEKILSGEETLPTDWAVSGTTGYDLLNLLGRLQTDGDGLQKLRAFYDEVTGNTARPVDVIYESKRTVLFSTMASELQMLAARLYRIAQGHRASRDFTRPMLQRAIREIIACMSVYRTYVRIDSWDVGDADYRVVSTAVRMAKRRNRSLPSPVFDYIASVLLLEHPPTITDEQAAERREFTLKFQQVSGPVTAKGVEDTAFYRFYPLASLNEVGGELDAKALPVDEFHRLMRHRMELWPHSMSGTATHDTKRGEDFRARLHVLSEVPDEWAAAFNRWRQMNEPLLRNVEGEPAPDINEQYLLYQTLVGTWPDSAMDETERDAYRDRMVQYMGKALKEAKIHTSWVNPSESYDNAISEFVAELFEDKGEVFRQDLEQFVQKIAGAGFVNSLAQLVLKLTVPGVPDFYQGTELWDFNLVDPDNRRPVDFFLRERQLNELLNAADSDIEEFAGELSQRWPDAIVKLWVTARTLNLRRELADVFTFGEYVPLTAIGPAADHVVAFARRHDDKCVVAVVPRLHYRLCRGNMSVNAWDETQLALPAGVARSWQCRLSGRAFDAGDTNEPILDVAELFQVFPVALLTSGAH